jgi:hypothetical protein
MSPAWSPVFRRLAIFEHSTTQTILTSCVGKPDRRTAPVREHNGRRDGDYAAQKEITGGTCCKKAAGDKPLSTRSGKLTAFLSVIYADLER